MWISWLLVSMPTLLGLILTPSTSTDKALVVAICVSCQFAMLAAAVSFAAHHRSTGCSASAWLAAALTLPPVAVGLDALASASLPVLDQSARGPAALYVIGGCVALVWVARSAGPDTPPRLEPVLMGFVGGSAVAGTEIALTQCPVPLDRPAWLTALALAALAALAVPAARAVMRYTDLPVASRVSTLLGGAFLTLGAAAPTWVPPSAATDAAMATFHFLAWVCFLAVSARLLATVIEVSCAGRVVVHRRAHLVEQELRHAEAVLHEVRATVAGIASASRLINSAAPLPEPTAQRLADMSRSELERMERLLGERAPLGVHPVDLVGVIAPLVESMRSRGHVVRSFDRNDHRALGRSDDVAEIVHILLDNAAQHGRGSAIHVDVLVRLGAVVLSVVNGGPDIPFTDRARMFEWGAGGPGSGGSGIGLSVARSRARAMGGDVRLASSAPGRTRFELVLMSALSESA